MGEMPLLDHLRFFGRGSAFSPEPNTSFMFTTKDTEGNATSVYVEMPMSSVKEIIAKDYTYNVSKFIICISHLHEDHVGGLGIFLSYLKYVKGVDLVKDVKILCPNNEEMAKYLDLTTKMDTTQLHICSGTIDIDLGPFDIPIRPKITIETIPTKHVEGMPSIGFLFLRKGEYHAQEESFFYTGDCTEIPERIYDKFKSGEIDELIAEISFQESAVHCSCSYYMKNFTISELGRIHFVHYDEPELMTKLKDTQEWIQDQGV